MRGLLQRQSAILHDLIRNYRSVEIGLNLLVQKVDGLRFVMDAPSEWADSAYAAILEMEQINATTIHERRLLNGEEIDIIDRQLSKLEQLAAQLPSL